MPHQAEAIKYASTRSAVLDASEMGTGKSPTAVGICNADPTITRVLIICPATLKLMWAESVWPKWDVKRLSVGVVKKTFPDTDVVVLNYDILRKFRADIRAREWDLLIADECFLGGTKVFTKRGWIKIGEVVNNRRRLEVLSFNHETQKAQWKLITGFIKKPLRNRLVRVRYVGGSFICTENHEIWTSAGYKKAKELCYGETLFILSKAIFDEASGAAILQSFVRPSKFIERPGISAEVPYTKISSCCKAMSPVSKGILYAPIRLCETEILQPQMLGASSFRNAGKQGNFSGSHERTHGLLAGEEAPRYIATDEKEKSDVSPRDERKNGVVVSRANFPCSRRKRHVNAATISRARENKFSDGVRNKNRRRKKSISESANLLQSGFSRSAVQDGNRDRRENASATKMAISRSSKNCGIELSRVVSVEILKRGDYRKSRRSCEPDSYVYCLEVEGNHNFFADGVLVSNCHFLKSAKSIRKREVLGGVYRDSEKRIVDRVSPIRAKRRLFLTGTPIVNATKDLWNLVRSLDPDGLGANWHKFASRYCGLIELTRRNWKTGKDEHVGWKWDGAENLDELQRIMRERFMIRKTKAEVLTDLPSKTRTVILLEGNKSLDKLLQAEKMEYDKFKSSDEDLDLSFETLSQLRREVGEAKVPFVVKYIEEILNEVPKVCIFCRHHSVIDRIATAFGTACVVLDGRTTTEDRQRNVARFQNDPAIQVFVGSISAAGVGITLTSASVAVFAELEWTPSAISQAEDRLWRYGQKNAVTVIHLILRGSLDEHIVNVVMRKQNTVDKVLQ